MGDTYPKCHNSVFQLKNNLKPNTYIVSQTAWVTFIQCASVEDEKPPSRTVNNKTSKAVIYGSAQQCSNERNTTHVCSHAVQPR